jgi:hypothetical protein
MARPRARAASGYVFNSGVKKMRRKLTLVSLGLVLLFGSAGYYTKAEVRRVQMHIAGYLCGN